MASHATGGGTGFRKHSAGLLRRKLLGISRCCLHDSGADLATLGVNNSDDITLLVIARATGARPLFPLGAVRVVLDLRLTMHNGPVGRHQEKILRAVTP